jgi:hypothetical protein
MLGLFLRPWGLGRTMPEKEGCERLSVAAPFLRFGLSSWKRSRARGDAAPRNSAAVETIPIAASRLKAPGLLVRCAECPMNYQAFTNGSLTLMYEAVRGALAADDALKGQGQETRFGVRETPEWKEHAAALEAEMLKRGMSFEVIDWSEDQAPLPFE